MNYIAWARKQVTNFLLVQLFINMLTWPLFLHWGLPITPLSIIGNLVFGPFLTIFLVVSSLLVTFELCYLPCKLLYYSLEWITRAWLTLIYLPTPDCMITFITPPLIISLCAPFAAIWIMISKKISSKQSKIAALFLYYIIFMIIFSLHKKPTSCTIPYGTHSVIVTREKGILTLIDAGFSRKKNGINQWINYTLLPHLGTYFGRQTVDTVIIKKKSPNTILFAQELQQRVRAKTIIFQDEREGTMPSVHAVPSISSQSP